jgi:hypothetical protein
MAPGEPPINNELMTAETTAWTNTLQFKGRPPTFTIHSYMVLQQMTRRCSLFNRPRRQTCACPWSSITNRMASREGGGGACSNAPADAACGADTGVSDGHEHDQSSQEYQTGMDMDRSCFPWLETARQWAYIMMRWWSFDWVSCTQYVPCTALSKHLQFCMFIWIDFASILQIRMNSFNLSGNSKHISLCNMLYSNFISISSLLLSLFC